MNERIYQPNNDSLSMEDALRNRVESGRMPVQEPKVFELPMDDYYLDNPIDEPEPVTQMIEVKRVNTEDDGHEIALSVHEALELKKRELANLQKNRDELTDKYDEYAISHKKLEENRQKLEEVSDAWLKQKKEITEELNSNNLHQEELRSAISKLQLLLEELGIESDEASPRIVEYKEALKGVDEKIAKLSSEVKYGDDEMVRRTGEIDLEQQKIDDLCKEIITKIDAIDSNILATQNEVKDLKDRLEKAEEKKQQANSRAESSNNLVDSSIRAKIDELFAGLSSVPESVSDNDNNYDSDAKQVELPLIAPRDRKVQLESAAEALCIVPEVTESIKDVSLAERMPGIKFASDNHAEEQRPKYEHNFLGFARKRKKLTALGALGLAASFAIPAVFGANANSKDVKASTGITAEIVSKFDAKSASNSDIAKELQPDCNNQAPVDNLIARDTLMSEAGIIWELKSDEPRVLFGSNDENSKVNIPEGEIKTLICDWDENGGVRVSGNYIDVDLTKSGVLSIVSSGKDEKPAYFTPPFGKNDTAASLGLDDANFETLKKQYSEVSPISLQSLVMNGITKRLEEEPGFIKEEVTKIANEKAVDFLKKRLAGLSLDKKYEIRVTGSIDTYKAVTSSIDVPSFIDYENLDLTINKK